jgi:hypothetical protein
VSRWRSAGCTGWPGRPACAAWTPILDPALLKDRGIPGSNLALIAIGAISAGQMVLVALYLQEGRGLSPLLTGLCFVPQAAGAFALADPAGRKPDVQV